MPKATKNLLAYTGIGSRETPLDILVEMEDFARKMANSGLVLRSGGAPGADTAFYSGAKHTDLVEIYEPWRGFSGCPAEHVALPEPQQEAYEIAAQYHPAWTRLSSAVQKFHARNVHQVLGKDVTSPRPSVFVMCWTPGGKLKGGTAQALRIAYDNGITVFNLGGL